MTERAAAVAECEASGVVLKKEKVLKEKKKKGYCDVKEILKEVKSAGKSKIYYLVEWEG